MPGKMEGHRYHVDNPQDENKLQEDKIPHEPHEHDELGAEPPGESSDLVSGEVEAKEWTPEMDKAAMDKRLAKEKKEEEERAAEWGDEPTNPG